VVMFRIFSASPGAATRIVVGLFAASGCSSNTETGSPGLTCGPGTFEQDGQCHPVEGGAGGTAGAGGAEPNGSGGGVGGTGGTAGGAGGTVDPSGGCPKGLPGPLLVEVSTPGGKKYCIDSTEVTGEQYRAFFEAKVLPVNGLPDMSGQPVGCEDNTSYTDGWVHNSPQGAMPAYDVDWCDAYMFCAWAGKHLCGAVGGGAITSLAEMNDPEKSEWYNACSSGGRYEYPYGDTYEPTACNTEDYAGMKPLPREVPAVETCRGAEPPFDAVFDMLGNVSEWVNWTEADRKGAVGGSYNGEPFTCASGAALGAWNSRSPSLGFRCCAELEK